jgi:hypothetical protein
MRTIKRNVRWLAVIAVITLLVGALVVGRKTRHRPARNDARTTDMAANEMPAAKRITQPVVLAAAGVDEPYRPIPVLTFVSDMHRDVCACRDSACLDSVNERYRAMAGRQAPMTASDEAAYLDFSRSTRPCVQRILDAEASAHDN